MNRFKKIISIILSLTIAISASVSVNAESVDSEPTLRNITEYKEYLADEGYPVFTTAKFYGLFNAFSTVARLITGRWLFPQEKFNVEVDEFLTGVSEEITLNSGLDFLAILNNLPQSNQLAEIITTTFNIDTAEMRRQFHGKSDEYFAEGNAVLGAVYGIISIYYSVITKCEIYSVPKEEEPHIYDVYIRRMYR